MPRIESLSGTAAVTIFLLFGFHSANSADRVPLATEDHRPCEMLKIKVSRQVLAEVNDKLFGQFMERAEPDEPGPESALNPTGNALRKDVLAALTEMNVPTIRFPGGTKIERGRLWTDLVDGAFDRSTPERPPGCRFGFDEFLSLCEQMKSDPVLVVAISHSLQPQRNQSLEFSANQSAALAAYVGASVDADLPPDLLRWARLREANGRRNPYFVPYWQIGNEAFDAVRTELDKTSLSPEEKGLRYIEIVDAHLSAIQRVLPTAKFIVEIQIIKTYPVAEQLIQRLGSRVAYWSHHFYLPWSMRTIGFSPESGAPVSDYPSQKFSATDYWYTLNSATVKADGLASYLPAVYVSRFATTGIPLAVTEWNINGWWERMPDRVNLQMPRSLFTHGVATANFLHAFMRNAASIQMCHQSTLVGSGWILAALQVKEEDPAFLRHNPTGLLTTMYRHAHGNELLATELEGQQFYRQPFQIGFITPVESVAYVDPVVTRKGEKLFIHVINRDRDRERPIRVDVSAWGTPRSIILHRMMGRTNNSPADGEPISPAAVEKISLPLDRATPPAELQFALAPASVSIYEILMTP